MGSSSMPMSPESLSPGKQVSPYYQFKNNRPSVDDSIRGEADNLISFIVFFFKMKNLDIRFYLFHEMPWNVSHTIFYNTFARHDIIH